MFGCYTFFPHLVLRIFLTDASLIIRLLHSPKQRKRVILSSILTRDQGLNLTRRLKLDTKSCIRLQYLVGLQETGLSFWRMYLVPLQHSKRLKLQLTMNNKYFYKYYFRKHCDYWADSKNNQALMCSLSYCCCRKKMESKHTVSSICGRSPHIFAMSRVLQFPPMESLR